MTVPLGVGWLLHGDELGHQVARTGVGGTLKTALVYVDSQDCPESDGV